MLIHVLDHHSESQNICKVMLHVRSNNCPKQWFHLKWLLHVGSVLLPGLCSSRARWPLAPNVCPWATRKSQIFYTNHMLGTIEFYSFRALGSLQFSLEHSLDYLDQFIVGKNSNKKFKFCTCKNDTSGQRMTSTAWVMFPVKSVPSRRMSIKL